jgi:hypothetical protein
MIPQINILTVVDVIAALSAGTLTNNISMTNNRQGKHTSGMGTDALTTDTTYTQVLNWHVMPVDFQTDIKINKITFYRNKTPVTTESTPILKLQKYGAPSGDYWAGVINYQNPTQGSPIEEGLYQYLIEFDMGRKIMAMEKFASLYISA